MGVALNNPFVISVIDSRLRVVVIVVPPTGWGVPVVIVLGIGYSQMQSRYRRRCRVSQLTECHWYRTEDALDSESSNGSGERRVSVRALDP